MPNFLERILSKAAGKKGFSGKKKSAYIYGAMNNMGAMKGNKVTPKGQAMQAKHEKDMGK